MSTTIIPAILTDSLVELEKEIHRLEPFFDVIHIDILDDTLVPGLTFDDVERVRLIKTTAKLELHFMVNDPARHLLHWDEVPHISRVLVHAEATGNIEKAFDKARDRGWEVGIVLNPETTTVAIEPYLSKVDVVQFMSVHPGTQGAPFLPEVPHKITVFYKAHPHITCSVDGAVSEKTIQQLEKAGVKRFVVGSYFKHSHDIQRSLQTLTSALA